MSTSRRAAVRYLALIYLEPGQLWRPEPTAPDAPRDPDAPDEIHLLRFESAGGLEAARQDPEMQALAGLRATLVRKAVLVPVADVPLRPYFAETT